MSIKRTYFTKDTTIVKNSCVNTGNNPVIELFYGGSTDFEKTKYSRYLFDFDIDSLRRDCGNLESTKHFLNMTNTSCFDAQTSCKTFCSSIGDVRRGTSFDLVLFTVPNSWDEGNGYDYVYAKNPTSNSNNEMYCESPTNWFQRKTNTDWGSGGVFSGDPYESVDVTVIGEQHFENGDENLCIDITDFVNNYLMSGSTSGSTDFNGFGIAYKYQQEVLTNEDSFYVGFFGKDTNTVYEPYINTTYEDVIIDDRDRFYLDKTNRLYIYINAGGQPSKATFNGVSIKDESDDEIVYIDGDDIKEQSCGVYYVDVNVPSSGYCANLMFTDTWEGIKINDSDLGDYEQEFILKDNKDYFTIGSTMAYGSNGLGVGSSNGLSIYDYSFRVSGIKEKEKIKRGDTRRVNVEARVPLTLNQVGVLDEIYYRVYIREGNTQIDYIDWSMVNRSFDGNFFILDTSWFIPNDYHLEIKIKSGEESITYDDVIKFEIVSEKTLC